jgi:hypothetical protein
MTPDGARLEISLDGQHMTTLDLGAPPAFNSGSGENEAHRRPNPRLNTSLEIPIPAGKHTILLQNTASDWIHIRDFTLTPYAPELAVLAKGDSDFAVLWIYRREKSSSQPISGKLSVPGLKDGSYHVVWWDTYQSKILKEETLSVSGSLMLTTPPIAEDVAVWIAHQSQ